MGLATVKKEEEAMVYWIVFGIVVIVSVALRITFVLKLLFLPFAYALVAPTLFYDWFHTHQLLAEGIGWGLIAIVAACWLFSLIRKIHGIVERRRDAEIEEISLLHKIKNENAP